MKLNRLLPLCGLLAGAWLLPACHQYSTENMAVTEQVEAAAEPAAAPDAAANAADTIGPESRENYTVIHENPFLDARRNPLSTFAIDVDKAFYANVRRFLTQDRQLPPPDAVRLEELVNYFPYSYPQPTTGPASLNAEVAACPWNPAHQLVLVGVQGKQVSTENLPPANLVFLLDVSGSMEDPDKLPLLKESLRELVQQALRPQDYVSIVVYAGAAGLVLPPTPGTNSEAILEALDELQAGGSTAGGQGLRLAYQVARRHFRAGGNNRIILATDGDFNVGEQSDADMERLVTQERESGVFLSVLGFGRGNLQDSRMELLADKGNGNYAYIDNIGEARRVLVSQFGGTLFTLAKDVKVQVEFNPALVREYRLLGYENRLLAAEDFNDDRKDAGELGAGQQVTALYEVVPAGAPASSAATVDALKYQTTATAPAATASHELLTVKLRYQEPQGSPSRLLTLPVRGFRFNEPIAQASDNLRLAASVAQFGLLLRHSRHGGTATWESTAALARSVAGPDADGARAEFRELVQQAAMLSSAVAAGR
ncbi:vWA domain-containing protein [Hymenobacter psychrotolerans]|uniref:Ca-activated chloride channel family protein n=1 Tax=Hymenobacter psychrotolerans DSM 18569 TaxID=1121959 RepID=A0A1M6QDQ7_9BACT|nr:VWA domain-containing protein [Hymenobacter psychrotolerans]SHK18372.1 Ca-activated chloride channel family protein [Hymenobacter psychrotolerans DSM 18569]